MKYNQFNYHRASPFHRQGFLPDIALLNRHQKQFPSDIPKGENFFTEAGRRHYQNKFNHSEIDQERILKSPERYPFEHRIAFDKTYRRNLDTIDIEGAASSTRINQSIKNRYRAQEELARRQNQSLDLKENLDKTYEVKRREIAMKQFKQLEDKKNKKEIQADQEQSISDTLISSNEINPQQRNITHKASNDSNKNNTISYNDQQPYNSSQQSYHSDQQLTDQYNKYISTTTTSDKYNKYGPSKLQYLDHHQMQEMPMQYNINNYNNQYGSNPYSNPNSNPNSNSNINANSLIQNHEKTQTNNLPLLSYPNQYSSNPMPNEKVQEYYRLRALQKEKAERQQLVKNLVGVNNRHKSNPQYLNSFNLDLLKKKEQTQILDLEAQSNKEGFDRKQFRKQNPTNLSQSSFNMAAQNIVTHNMKNIELTSRAIY